MQRVHIKAIRINCYFLILAVGTLLTACSWLSSAPESRARDFIQTLALDPANTVKLRERGNLKENINPNDLLTDLGSQVAMRFLQAQKQVDTLQFSIGDAAWPDRGHQSITIFVHAAKDNKKNIAAFIVDFEKHKDRGWTIIKVRAA